VLLESPKLLPECIDLKSLLMHGQLSTAGSESKTFHAALVDAHTAQPDVEFYGSSKLHGTKMIIHDSASASSSGKVRFTSAVRWCEGTHVALEVLGAAPGSSLLVALELREDGTTWDVQPSIHNATVLDGPATCPLIPSSGLALLINVLEIDRPVADICLLANTGSGWQQRMAARATVPDPFLLDISCAADDVLVSFSDVFMRKVKCPVLRASGLGAALARHAACPAPAMHLSLAATSCQPDTQTAPIVQSSIQEAAGHSKPFLCPDGKRFTTRKNAERWLQKQGSVLEAKLAAPSSDDANAIMQHMAAAEAAAQALDSMQRGAAAGRPASVLSCPQLTISSTSTAGWTTLATDFGPLMFHVLRISASSLKDARAGLAVASLSALPFSKGALQMALQTATGSTEDDIGGLWTKLHASAPLWLSSAAPLDVVAVHKVLEALKRGQSVQLDSTVEAQQWKAHISNE
jgi:hypothetical protein